MPRFGKGYDTVEDAAAAALMWLARQPRADQMEYMTVLLQDPETQKFFRSDFQTEGSKESSSWRGVPEGKLAGTVHNHPVAGMRDRYPSTHFSETDVDTAVQFDEPAFIAGMMRDGPAEHRVYQPNKHHVGRSRPGEEFLAQFPIEEFAQALMKQLLGRSPIDPRGLRKEGGKQLQADSSQLRQLPPMESILKMINQLQDEVVPTRGARQILATAE